MMRHQGFAAVRRSLYAVMLGGAGIVLGAGAAQAQAVVGGFTSNYSSNANKPIDIVADMLEVDDKKKVATFKGSVVATQGDFNMKARELVVNYTTGGAGAGKKPAGDAASASANAGGAGVLPGGGAGEINEIRAVGDVVLVTKDSQEARSDHALFDVKAQLVTLTGSVRLAKGADNVIKGEKVLIDIAKGTTTIDNSTSGRISATFQPKERETKDKKKRSSPNSLTRRLPEARERPGPTPPLFSN